MTPRRIRLSRARGWRLPDGARSVARPGRYGNPYRSVDGDLATQALAVRYHREDIEEGRAFAYGSEVALTVDDIVADLAGCDLACWCHLCDLHVDGLPLGTVCADCDPCHASTLLDLANPLENR